MANRQYQKGILFLCKVVLVLEYKSSEYDSLLGIVHHKISIIEIINSMLPHLGQWITMKSALDILREHMLI
ncbi:MAG: hypothetical protein ACTSPC_12215, partial [Candidatus Heimdallarchaeota archaeon]